MCACDRATYSDGSSLPLEPSETTLLGFCIENAITFTSMRVIFLKLGKTASDRLIHRNSPSGAILGAIQVDFVSIEVDLVPSKGKLLGEPHPRTESDSQIRHPVRIKLRNDRAQPLFFSIS